MLLFFNQNYPDESLCSLLYRTAKENFMDQLNWIFINFKDFSGENVIPNEVNWLTGIKLKAIANFLGISMNEAESLTYHPVLEHLGLEVKSVEKNPWFLYSRIKCCPLCLQETVYHRKRWACSYTLICSKHKVLLMDRCPFCNCLFDMLSIIKNQCKGCNSNISDYIPTRVDADSILVDFQLTIDHLLNESYFQFDHNWIKDKKGLINALEFLGCWSARFLNKEELFCEELCIGYNGRALERNHLKNAKQIEHAICIYIFAFKILQHWPRKFHDLLRQSEKKNKKEYRYFIQNTVPTLYGSNLSPISSELNNYIAYTHLNLDKQKNYLRSDQIRLITNKFDAGVIESNLIPIYRTKYLQQPVSLVCTNDLFYFMNMYENSISKEQLRMRWNTSAKSTFSLLQNNLLENVFNFKVGPLTTWVIPLISVESFESKLRSLSSNSMDSPITIRNAMEWISPSNSIILMKGILNRRITICISNIKLADSTVSKSKVYHYVTEAFISGGTTDGFISIRELIFILGVKKSDIIHWIKTGRFGSFSYSGEDNIPISTFQYFNDQFITTLQISMENNIPIKKILKKHQIGKISSVSGPKHRDGNRLLFYRQQIIRTFMGKSS
ncbi:TniQ family protein [Neobacillus terrae]|uniref:TniQ family protein n=1 Tax=Neobacillus terrae TaxID=3034837 RepID=UPI00140AC205|nr:TniQ family protein [Neobacillus terrae]NHM32436.1 TniQ family protein [Neobacillus terrae]